MTLVCVPKSRVLIWAREWSQMIDHKVLNLEMFLAHSGTNQNVIDAAVPNSRVYYIDGHEDIFEAKDKHHKCMVHIPHGQY